MPFLIAMAASIGVAGLAILDTSGISQSICRDISVISPWLTLALILFTATIIIYNRVSHRLRDAVDAAERATKRAAAADQELVVQRKAIDQAAIVAITDVTGKITYVNDNFCKISGYSREELLGNDHRILRSGVHPRECFREMYRTIARGNVWRGQLCNRAKNGSLYWVDTTIVPRLNEKGKPISYLAIRIDISTQKAAEQALIESMAETTLTLGHLESVLANIGEGICMIDKDNKIVLTNANYARMYGLSAEDIKPGTYLGDVIPKAIRFKDRHSVGALSVNSMLRAKTATREMSDGRIIHISRRTIPSGGLVSVHRDITEQERSVAKISYMAQHDALTGMANRILLDQSLREALAEIGIDSRFALHIVDLDHFKTINDTLGHPIGDRLLQVVAERIHATVRKTDTIARLGGDEFAIVQRNIESHDDAAALAQRLIQTIGRTIVIEGHRISVGASIGVAIAPTDGESPELLLRNADLALYRSKDAGRGGMHFFEAGLDKRMQERRRLQDDLRDALASNQLELFYQPLVTVDTRELRAAEALLRWRHPERGLVSPADFIPLAEETGQIIEIAEWALMEACRTAAQWPAHVCIAVNLSPVQFKKPGLVEMVTAALAKTRLDPHRLELEITESVLLEATDTVDRQLRQLRALGVRIALDDFGTGYSSLGYLQRFPFDKIKIDRAFVDHLPKTQRAQAIVRAIVDLARALNMSVVAEGVETEEQLSLVGTVGCTEAQGYLISAPVPLGTFNKRFESDIAAPASAAA